MCQIVEYKLTVKMHGILWVLNFLPVLNDLLIINDMLYFTVCLSVIFIRVSPQQFQVQVDEKSVKQIYGIYSKGNTNFILVLLIQ